MNNADNKSVDAFEVIPDDSNRLVPSKGSSSHSEIEELEIRFGRFRIQKLLGKGHRGPVHLAHDPQFDHNVVLKLPRTAAVAEPLSSGSARRLRRELQRLTVLRHRNLCPIQEVGDVDGTLFIAMRYVEGQPLSNFIADGKQAPFRIAAAIAHKLAFALTYAHSRHVTHGNLTIGKILVDQQHEPIILSIGLEMLSEITPSTPLVDVASGIESGRPAIPAASERYAVGQRRDIFGLGLILYYLLTGQSAGAGTTVEEQMAAARARPPQRIRSLRPDVDGQLGTICLRMITQRPNKQFASMHDVADALARWRKQRGDHCTDMDQSRETEIAELIDEVDRASAAGRSDIVVSAAFRLLELAEKEKHGAALYGACRAQRLHSQVVKQATDKRDVARERARHELEKHDYDAALTALNQIHPALWDDEIWTLWDKALTGQEDVATLRQRLQKAVATRRQLRARPSAEQLLRLQPGEPLATEVLRRCELSQQRRLFAKTITIALLAGAAAGVPLLWHTHPELFQWKKTAATSIQNANRTDAVDDRDKAGDQTPPGDTEPSPRIAGVEGGERGSDSVAATTNEMSRVTKEPLQPVQPNDRMINETASVSPMPSEARAPESTMQPPFELNKSENIPRLQGPDVKPLFNGRDLTGWMTYRFRTHGRTGLFEPTTGRGWEAANGMLVCTGGTIVLVSDQQFHNFIMEMDVRTPIDGGTAVGVQRGIRDNSGTTIIFPADFAARVKTNTPAPQRRPGMDQFRQATAQIALDVGGDWHHLIVSCNDLSVQFWLDGEPARSDQIIRMIGRSDRRDDGHIVLGFPDRSAYGAAFRNIQIQAQ